MELFEGFGEASFEILITEDLPCTRMCDECKKSRGSWLELADIRNLVLILNPN